MGYGLLYAATTSDTLPARAHTAFSQQKAFYADKLVVFQAVNWQYIVGLKVYYALQQLCTNCTRIPLSKLL